MISTIELLFDFAFEELSYVDVASSSPVRVILIRPYSVLVTTH